MKTHQNFSLLFLFGVAVLGLAACGGPDPVRVFVTPTPVIERPTPVTSVPVAAGITPQPTSPPPPPGVTFGPIVGPDFTPEPLHTALPETVRVRPCQVRITAPQVSLYQSPDTNTAVTGTASERESLLVSQITADSAGSRWVNTPKGWLMLAGGGVEMAQLASLRQCNILAGEDPDTTLAGLHVLNGNSYNAVISFVQRMVNSGHPIGTIKGLNGSEKLLNDIKQISPQTVIVYRSILSPDGMGDCPADILEAPDPVKTARRWLAGLKSYWDEVDADYYEFINECPASLSWIARFSVEAMKVANEQGRCLLLFSFPGGES